MELQKPTTVGEIKRRVNSKVWTANEQWCIDAIRFLLGANDELEQALDLHQHHIIDGVCDRCPSSVIEGGTQV